MKATKRMIEAFHGVIEHLENDGRYHWEYPALCNCGVLACQLLGINQNDLSTWLAMEPVKFAHWSTGARSSICPETGLYSNQILNALTKHGIDKDDFHRVEYCGRDRETVIKWFRKEVVKLEKRWIEEGRQK